MPICCQGHLQLAQEQCCQLLTVQLRGIHVGKASENSAVYSMKTRPE